MRRFSSLLLFIFDQGEGSRFVPNSGLHSSSVLRFIHCQEEVFTPLTGIIPLIYPKLKAFKSKSCHW